MLVQFPRVLELSGDQGNVDENEIMKLGHSLWFLLFLLAAEPALAQEMLVFTTADGYPYYTPEKTGFLDAVLQEVMGRIGIGFKVVTLPAERALINANAGIDDGVTNRIAGLEKFYPNLIPVPEVISNRKFAAFAKEVKFPTTGWKSLKPYSVGIITGWKIFEHNVTEAAQITKVKNVTQLFNLLVNGRTHVALYETWQGLSHLRRNKISGVTVLQPPLAEKDEFLYLHKKHRNLVPKITASLRAVKADGTYQRLVDKLLTPLAAE